PQSLYNLLIQINSDSDESFVTHIRAYNQILAFTSLGVNLDKELANAKKGVYTFRIQGALYHQIGDLILRYNDDKPLFAQIYFYDSNLDNQLQRRQEMFPNLNADMLKELQDKLNIINPFVKQFETSGIKAKTESDNSHWRMVIHNTY
ncbi:9965_t:CDS:1, partial [Funneliformis geosporum]